MGTMLKNPDSQLPGVQIRFANISKVLFFDHCSHRLPPKSRLPTASRAHLVRKHLKCVVFQSLFPLTGFPVNGNNAPRIPTANCWACKSDSFMQTTLKHYFLQILTDLLEIDSRQGWRDASLARGNGCARQGSRLTMLASETASTLPREGAGWSSNPLGGRPDDSRGLARRKIGAGQCLRAKARRRCRAKTLNNH